MTAKFSNISRIPIIEGYPSSAIVNTDSLPDTVQLPPPLPLNNIYTSCYCEENVYLLAQTFIKNPSVAINWSTYVLFLSNETKSVALWNQRSKEDGIVIWDYHVILALKLRTLPENDLNAPPNIWVYDMDSRSDIPCRWQDYFITTFPYLLQNSGEGQIDTQFRSLVRIVPAELYIAYFASDRTHMTIPRENIGSPIHPTSEYSSVSIANQAAEEACTMPDEKQQTNLQYYSPPPSYPCIQGTAAAERGVCNNLMSSFVHMKIIVDSQMSPDSSSSAKELEYKGDASGEKAVEIEMGKVYDVWDAFIWGLEENIQ